VRLVFLDTNVMLYCFDDFDPVKRDRAREWVASCWTRRCGRISMQVLNEFYSKARAKFPQAISMSEARAQVRRYENWVPWSMDHPTIEAAWAIESRYGLNYWDALIVAAAQAQGCTHLITEDLQHEQRIDSVQVINPFLVGPELLDAPAP
jgi:predicted nucleic acid-binding protein